MALKEVSMDGIASWQETFSVMIGTTVGQILGYLPRLAAAIAVFVLGIILGNWLKAAVIKAFQLLRVESLVKDSKLKTFLAKAEVTQKLEEIIGSILKWIIVLVFFIASTNILGLNTVASMLAGVLSYVPNVVSAVIVMAIGVLLAGIVEGVVKGALASVDLRSARLMGKIASYTVVTIAILAAFSELKIAENFINILFIGFVAMLALGLGLAIGLGAKDVVNKMLTEWHGNLTKELKKK